MLAQSAKQKVGRYALLTGPRGSGKSHLMTLLGHRLRPYAERGELLLVELGEEEHIAQLVAFIAKILAALPDRDGAPTAAELVRLVQTTPRTEQLNTAVSLLEERVATTPLVLLVENLDRLFDAIKPDGQSRLRALLAAHPGWCLFGASCTYGATFTSANLPFYQSFERFTLAPLSLEECVEMLRRLAALHDDKLLLRDLSGEIGRAQVGAIRHLLGANPRALALVFPFLRHRRLGDLEGVFVDLAEELTPYFQEQMARRPPGQQPYLEQLAECWGTLSVSELAERCFDNPTTASGQLRYLHQDGLVRSLRVGRETFYELADPLHRIAWAMKRPERLPSALAKFVAAWIPRREVGERMGGLRGVELSGSVYAAALMLPFEDESAYAKLSRERIKQQESKDPHAAYEGVKDLAEREGHWTHYLDVFELACRIDAPELELWAEKLVELAEVPPLDEEKSDEDEGEGDGNEPKDRRSFAQMLIDVFAGAILSHMFEYKRRLNEPLMERVRALAERSTRPKVWELLLMEHGAAREVLEAVAERLAEHYRAGNTIQWPSLLRSLFNAGEFAKVRLLGLAAPMRSLSAPDRLGLVIALMGLQDAAALASLGEDLWESVRGENAHALKALRLVFADPATGLKIARAALKRWPDSLWLLAAAQRASVQVGDMNGLVQYAKRLLDLGFNPELSHSNLAIAYQRLGKDAQAQIHMVEALKGSPDSPVYANIALMMLDDPARLLQTFDTHNHPAAQRLKALARLALGEAVPPIAPLTQPVLFDEAFVFGVSAVQALHLSGSPMGLQRWLDAFPLDEHPIALDMVGYWLIMLRAESPPTSLTEAHWKIIRERLPEAAFEMLSALAALPENPRPYAQLAAPARVVLRTLITSMKAKPLLDALPDEPE
ncbi:hypothetical protein L6R46_04845 [Myxococcota bacterium]|nr:hypothetical protein [Myxococcota bacterium]